MPFTDAEMETARDTDLPELLEHLGYQVRRVGRYHTTKEMDSLRIKNRRTWRRYSENVGGDAITFLQRFQNMSFPETVNYLLDYHGRARDHKQISSKMNMSRMLREAPERGQLEQPRQPPQRQESQRETQREAQEQEGRQRPPDGPSRPPQTVREVVIAQSRRVDGRPKTVSRSGPASPGTRASSDTSKAGTTRTMRERPLGGGTAEGIPGTAGPAE